jgi:hypothetical protein
LPKEEHESLKGLIWPFRQAPEDVSDEDWARLEPVFGLLPKLERAYWLREELSDIFDQNYTKAEAQRELQDWCKRVENSDIREFDSFLTTLRNWFTTSWNVEPVGLWRALTIESRC